MLHQQKLSIQQSRHSDLRFGSVSWPCDGHECLHTIVLLRTLQEFLELRADLLHAGRLRHTARTTDRSVGFQSIDRKRKECHQAREIAFDSLSQLRGSATVFFRLVRRLAKPAFDVGNLLLSELYVVPGFFQILHFFDA